MENLPDYFSARTIARATGASKKTVHRTAAREGWPVKRDGNRDEYQVPPNIAAIIIAKPQDGKTEAAITVRFADLTGSDAQRENVLLREKAVKLLMANLAFGKERALTLVIQHMNTEHPLFKLNNKITLRQWHAKYLAAGLDGLVEQKRGRVGVLPPLPHPNLYCNARWCKRGLRCGERHSCRQTTWGMCGCATSPGDVYIGRRQEVIPRAQGTGVHYYGHVVPRHKQGLPGREEVH